MRRGILFDCTKGIFYEDGPNAFFLWDLHYKIPIGLFSIGYDPMNQTPCVGNFP
jgi:hypothetical protein